MELRIKLTSFSSLLGYKTAVATGKTGQVFQANKYSLKALKRNCDPANRWPVIFRHPVYPWDTSFILLRRTKCVNQIEHQAMSLLPHQAIPFTAFLLYLSWCNMPLRSKAVIVPELELFLDQYQCCCVGSRFSRHCFRPSSVTVPGQIEPK